MSGDNIPFDIQVKIIKKLPVKSLIQFRSVSKAWKSLIDSSRFIARYNGQVQHLLVTYLDSFDIDLKYVSIVDDDTFPQQRVSVSVHSLVNMVKYPDIIGSSHGLLCLYGFYARGCVDHHIDETNMACVVWNVSIRKAVAVVVPNVGPGIYAVLGFGVCHETIDPKIVKMSQTYGREDMQPLPWQVEVFTLSTGAWRSPYSNLPRKSIQFFHCYVCLDGFLYWIAKDRVNVDNVISCHNLIVSFDMTSEEFREANLPDSLALSNSDLTISKLRKSLVVLEFTNNEMVYVLWTMGGGVSELCTKLFTIDTPGFRVMRVLEFRKSGEPVIKIVEHHRERFHDSSSLVVYEPCSKQIYNLGFNELYAIPSACSYMESLLLLDQPDYIIYDKGERYIENFKGES